MPAIDTNVLVRLLTADDANQTLRAEAFLSRGPAWISTVVLVETVWVLTAVYGWSKAQLHVMLQKLADSRDFSVQDSQIVLAAVDLFRNNKADFADCLALELSRAYDHLPFGTFDKNATKLPGAMTP